MKKLFLVALLYGVVVLLVFGGALWPGQGQLIFGDDIHHQYYFYREFFNNFFKGGMFPWWNPYNFGGAPFIANSILNIWYPPTWLFLLLPLNIAYSWHLALHILWAMVGMYFFLSGILNRSGNEFFGDSRSSSSQSSRFSHASLSEDSAVRFLQSLVPRVGRIFSAPKNSSHRVTIAFPVSLPALVGGLLFGLSGFFMARVWAGHVDVIAAASWMPLVISANLKAQNSKQKKDIVVAALVMAMQILAGYHTMAFFTLEAVGLMTLFFCFQNRSAVPAFRATLAVLLAIGLAAIQLVPEMELVRQSIRSYSLPYSWASYGALTWESIKQLFHPFFFGDQLTYTGPAPNYIEHAAFVGRVGLGLAILAVLVFLYTCITSHKSAKKRRDFFWIAVFGIIPWLGLWVSLGPNVPVDLQKILWTVIPIYHSLRIPSRHLILFVFGASALAGIGLHIILSRLSKAYVQVPVGRSKYTLHFSSVVGGLVILIVLVEMVPFGRHFIGLQPIPEIRQDDKLIATLKQDTQPYRLLQNFGVWVSPQRDALEFDGTMSKQIFSATGYDIAILSSYYEFIDAATGNRGSSIFAQDVQVPYITKFTPWVDFLNIKYIMHPRAYDPLSGTNNDRFTLTREDAKYDYRLYENKMVLPRFFFVHDSLVEPSGTEVLAKIRDGSVNPHTTVLFEKTKYVSPLSPCKRPDTSVSVTSYTPNRIELSVQNSCDAYLVSSEVYYPGWAAYIDGKKTDIIKGNYAFRTLFVPAGNHTVLFLFAPSIFMIGGVITFVSAMVMVFLLKFKRKRDNK